MTEAQVGFLYKAAATLQDSKNRSSTLLRSYYLMRCKDITKGFGLPEKHFSSKARCSKCCIEWRVGSGVKVHAIKLSKKQRRRLRSKKVTKANKETLKRRKEMLGSNELEQICIVCGNTTITSIPKPKKINEKLISCSSMDVPPGNSNDNKDKNDRKKDIKKNKDNTGNDKNAASKGIVNIYSPTEDIFNYSVNSNSNTSKETPKIIKNNKRKKDKFAGLCQKAVLASAKLKETKNKDNKLNLFLKPSK